MSSNKDKDSKKSKRKKSVKYTIWALKGIGVFLALVIIFLVSVNFNLFGLFGKCPSMASIMNPPVNNASNIYSADGKLIGKFYRENRIRSNYTDVNPVFWDALISTEDERFYDHDGIDFWGVGAAFKDFLVHGQGRGASTITQQLAKNLFKVRTDYSTGVLGKVPGFRMLIIKAKEWLTAMKLELFFSKKEILNMYANTVSFGNNTYGIKTACKVYFNKEPKEMNAEEAALLVGILKATTFYNPILNPEKSHQRRNVVLDNMRRNGYLTQTECDSITALPMTLDFHPDNAQDNLCNYFRDAVANDLAEWCNVADVDLYADGLKIYTTIDSRMQRYAEEAVVKDMRRLQGDFNVYWRGKEPWAKEQPDLIESIAKKTKYYNELKEIFPDNPDSIDFYLNKPHLTKVFSYNDSEKLENMSVMDSIRYMCKFLHCAFVAMNPKDGHVKAWVGDIDYKTWQFDNARATHQPGSTFKLFVYTEAMNQGLCPCDRREDTPISIEVPDENGGTKYWTPGNANGSYSGQNMTLKKAFAQSINSVAVKVGQEVGTGAIIHTAHEMGITTKLQNTPALALGSSDVKLIDMVDAYSTVANGGERVTPVLVSRIEDANGKVIYSAEIEKERVLPKRTAFLMQKMLMAGLRMGGATSLSLNGYVGDVYDTDFGAKTGTTNNDSDGWFMAVSPNLVCGAWVGGEYRSVHLRGRMGQGSRTALPVCGDFLYRVFHTPAFKSLHAHFSNPGGVLDADDEYECSDPNPIKNDSTSVDAFPADSTTTESATQTTEI